MSWTNLLKISLKGEFSESLLQKNIKQLRQTTIYGTTPLHFAIIGGNPDTVSFLLSHANIINKQNSFGETALHWACKEADESIVKILLSQNARIDTQDSEGNTPLHWAMEYNRPEIVRLLLDANARTDIKNDADSTPLQVANENKSHGCLSFIKLTKSNPAAVFTTLCNVRIK